jgi:hypothetical protein
MSDKEMGTTEESLKENSLSERRKFLKKAGKVALTAPAVALLLSAENSPAQAQQAAPSGVTAPSDRRLKQHVKRVGAIPNGLPLYSFQYIWGGPTFVGVMAQDVLRVMPDAVMTDPDGFYRVDYEMLGTRMMTLPHWREQHRIAA